MRLSRSRKTENIERHSTRSLATLPIALKRKHRTSNLISRRIYLSATLDSTVYPIVRTFCWYRLPTASSTYPRPRSWSLHLQKLRWSTWSESSLA